MLIQKAFSRLNYPTAVTLIVAMFALGGCKQQEVEWKGRPERDERIAFGLHDPEAQSLVEEIWESDDTSADKSLGLPTLVKEWLFHASNGYLMQLTIQRHGHIIQQLIYEHNDHGQLVSIEDIGPDKILNSFSTTTYFANGQIAETQWFNGQKRLKRRRQYAYDELLRLLTVKDISYQREDGDQRFARIETKDYIYGNDPDRYQIETKLNDQRSSMEWFAYGRADSTVTAAGHKTLYFYDLKGQLTGLKTTDAMNQPIEKREFVYDSIGQQTLEVNFGTNSEWVSTIRTGYDSLGQVVVRMEQFRIAPVIDSSDSTGIQTDRYEYFYGNYDRHGDWREMVEEKNGIAARRRWRNRIALF